MLTLVIVRALSLVSFSAGTELRAVRGPDSAPWVSPGYAIVYRTAGKSAQGRRPWATESLDRHAGVGPAIVSKGAL